MLNLLLAIHLAAAAAQVPTVPITEGFAVMDDGVRLYYRLAGTHGEVIVVPVAVLTAPYFDTLARKYRVLYYDPRARGRSDAGDLEKASKERNLQDLEGLRQHLGFNRWAMVGFSGYGLEFAMYSLEHPKRVTHLVQLAPVPPRLSPWMDSRGAGIQQRIDKTAASEYEALQKSGSAAGEAACRLYQRTMKPAFATHHERIDPAAICVHANEWPENQSKLWSAFMPTMQGVDVRARLAELRMPRLVMWPEHDLIPLEGVKEWIVPGAPVRLMTVPGADHSAFVDRPDVVMPAIEEFLERTAIAR
jgi:proline iminopeptidase